MKEKKRKKEKRPNIHTSGLRGGVMGEFPHYSLWPSLYIFFNDYVLFVELK